MDTNQPCAEAHYGVRQTSGEETPSCERPVSRAAGEGKMMSAARSGRTGIRPSSRSPPRGVEHMASDGSSLPVLGPFLFRAARRNDTRRALPTAGPSGMAEPKLERTSWQKYFATYRNWTPVFPVTIYLLLC